MVGRARLSAPPWAQAFRKLSSSPSWPCTDTNAEKALAVVKKVDDDILVERSEGKFRWLVQGQRDMAVDEGLTSPCTPPQQLSPPSPPQSPFSPKLLDDRGDGEAGNAGSGASSSCVRTAIDDAWAVRKLAEIRRRSRSIDASSSFALVQTSTSLNHVSRPTTTDKAFKGAENANNDGSRAVGSTPAVNAVFLKGRAASKNGDVHFLTQEDL